MYPSRLEHVVLAHDIETVRDLVHLSPDAVIRADGIGKVTLAETDHALRALIGTDWNGARIALGLDRPISEPHSYHPRYTSHPIQPTRR